MNPKKYKVTPRYKADYKENPCIITRDKNIFNVTCKGLRASGILFVTEKQGNHYIIREM